NPRLIARSPHVSPLARRLCQGRFLLPGTGGLAGPPVSVYAGSRFAAHFHAPGANCMAQIAAYATPSGPRYGLVADVVLHEWDGNPFSDRPVTPGKAIGPLDEQTLVLPVTPTKLVCIGRNYAAHAAEHQAAVPDEPMLFLKPPSALIPHRAPIRIPPGIGRVDHEAELAVIIGRRARRVRREDALDYVLGYTCANDVSARDFQKKDGQWGRAKGFDTFCPLGPVIATELDPSALDVRAILNGELRQNGNTRDMV